jgi:hypothetical protein
MAYNKSVLKNKNEVLSGEIMKIRLADWYDQSCDMCYSTTEAVLDIHGVSIPLCDNCIRELKRVLDEFLETYEINE